MSWINRHLLPHISLIYGFWLNSTRIIYVCFKEIQNWLTISRWVMSRFQKALIDRNVTIHWIRWQYQRTAASWYEHTTHSLLRGFGAPCYTGMKLWNRLTITVENIWRAILSIYSIRQENNRVWHKSTASNITKKRLSVNWTVVTTCDFAACNRHLVEMSRKYLKIIRSLEWRIFP